MNTHIAVNWYCYQKYPQYFSNIVASIGATFRMRYRYGYQRYFSHIFWQYSIPILLSSDATSANNITV